MTLIISWIAFFYLQFHQPNRFGRRNSKRSLGAFLNEYILGIDKKKKFKEELTKSRKQIVKENAHLLKENQNLANTQQDTLPVDGNRKREKLNKENFEYYYLQFLILFACVNIYDFPFDLPLDS